MATGREFLQAIIYSAGKLQDLPDEALDSPLIKEALKEAETALSDIDEDWEEASRVQPDLALQDAADQAHTDRIEERRADG